MINEYDELKTLLKRSRMLMEQPEATNLGKSIENKIKDDSTEYEVDGTENIDTEKVKKDKSKTYRISGGLLSLHGKEKKDVETALEKLDGKLIIKEFTAGYATLSTIESHYKKCLSQGFKADLIIIDYLDLLKSKTKRDNKLDETNDIFLAGRGLARKLKLPILSPCQMNRAGANDSIAEGDKIGGSYTKLQIADFSVSLSRKRKDKLNGTGRWHIVKNRYGPDGMTYGSTIDTSTGEINIDEEELGDADKIDSQVQQNNSQNYVSSSDKKLLASKFFSLER